MSTEENQIEKQLKKIQAVMASTLEGTNLARLLPENKNLLGSGKMLRSRLTLELGNANGIDERELTHAGAAVDMIHAASLLHDDVIDGGLIRRGAPTFWKKHGINGAILFGDFIMFKALSLLVDVDRVDLLSELIDRTGEVCRSETEQELILRGTPGTWEECELVGRFKTGSLFAFAAVAGGTREPGLTEALREAGYILGTAYQLADDVLDASGNEEVSGKTLGTDNDRGKTTAITATKNAPEDPVDYIYALLDASSAQLADWPEIQGTWDAFLNVTMKPVLSKHLAAK
jgi:geranylgeranyl pyrophosphate synthase